MTALPFECAFMLYNAERVRCLGIHTSTEVGSRGLRVRCEKRSSSLRHNHCTPQPVCACVCFMAFVRNPELEMCVRGEFSQIFLRPCV